MKVMSICFWEPPRRRLVIKSNVTSLLPLGHFRASSASPKTHEALAGKVGSARDRLLAR
jgi:hypothetical protein